MSHTDEPDFETRVTAVCERLALKFDALSGDAAPSHKRNADTVRDIARFHTDYLTVKNQDKEILYRALRYLEDTMPIQPTRLASEHLLHAALLVLLRLALPSDALSFEGQLFLDDLESGMNKLRVLSL